MKRKELILLCAMTIQMRDFSFKQRILRYFGIIIILLSSVALLSVYQSYRANRFYGRQFDELFLSTSLAVRLGTVHQELKNYINYENAELLPIFLESSDELFEYFVESRRTIVGDTLTADNQSLYYKFIDIENMISDYILGSRALVSDADFEESKFLIFDSFYELDQLKDFIYLAQTDLVFRQMLEAERFVTGVSRENRNRLITILALVAGSLSLSFVLSFRFSSQMSRPIQKLVSHAKLMTSEGFKSFEFTGACSREMRVLIDAFNGMIAQIVEQIDKLKDKAAIAQRLKNEEIRALRAENAHKHSELMYLQSQIKPHFLFNTLNMISSLAEIERAGMTRRMINSLSLLVRYVLKSTGLMTSIEDELIVVENYLVLQEARFSDRISHRISVPEDCKPIQIPSMIIQPLVENAIVHGLEPKEQGGIVSVSLMKDGDALRIQIEDDGVGMTGEQLAELEKTSRRDPEDGTSERDHIGLKNIIGRLKLTYGIDCLSISSSETRGTSITLLIPLDADPIAEG